MLAFYRLPGTGGAPAYQESMLIKSMCLFLPPGRKVASLSLSIEECERFNQAARNLLVTVRQKLGEHFAVIGALVEVKEDPDLDAYLRDPGGFTRQRELRSAFLAAEGRSAQ